MLATAEDRELYLDHFARLDKHLAAAQPALCELRQEAIRRFEQLGFPGPRHEDWKFTSLAPLVKVPFAVAEPDAAAALPRDLLPAPLRLIFVNGQFAPKLSALSGLTGGFVVTNLAVALERHGELVAAYLARLAASKDLPFTALNTAFLHDGAFVAIPEGQVLEQPIELLYLTSARGQPVVCHPRALIVTGKHSQVTVIERFLPAGSDDGTYFTNAVTEIAVNDHAVVDHYKLQQESRAGFHIASTHVAVGRAGNFRTHYVGLGGSLVRNEVRVRFNDEGGEATVNGLYLGRGRQHFDNHTVIDHARPHCASHELYKGVLSDKAHGVFNGKIFVRQDAQKTDAKQTNQTLLLSEDAVINTKPQLEIFADDVKCTHGATVGNLDEDAIFYLRSRGIDLHDARRLLTYAFANDIIERIRVEAIRTQLEQVLMSEELSA